MNEKHVHNSPESSFPDNHSQKIKHFRHQTKNFTSHEQMINTQTSRNKQKHLWCDERKKNLSLFTFSNTSNTSKLKKGRKMEFYRKTQTSSKKNQTKKF